MSIRMTKKTIEGDSLTPILIYRRLAGKQRFLLESSSQHNRSGRYSFIGVNPVKSYRGKGRKLEEYVYRTGRTYQHEGDLYSLLKRLMPRIAEAGSYPFMGGAVGYVSYPHDFVGEMKQTHAYDVYFNVYDTVIIYDHQLKEVILLHVEIDPECDKVDLNALAEQVMNGKVMPYEDVTLTPFKSTQSQRYFEQRVDQVIEAIQKQQVQQVVLSQKFEAQIAGDAFQLYRKLRKQNPSPYMYYMEFDSHVVLGTSPESLVRVSDRRVMTNPIAGTRRRGINEREDCRLAEELMNDPKELAEHDMLVQLSEQEMLAVCKATSIQVTTSKELVRYEHVMHLVSKLEGELLTGLHPLDALQATIPAGTVTGSPKERAMSLIQKLENEPRGIYGGAIGYIGLNGNIDFALTIRTMIIQDSKAIVQAGAGIVAASQPTAEYEETLNKAQSLVKLYSN